MANQTISQLPDAGPITGSELVPVVQNGGTYKTTAAALAGSPVQTQTFLTLNQEPTLNNSRYLTSAAGIGLDDGGPQSFLRINLNGASGSLESASNGIITKDSSASVVARTLTTTGAGLSVSDGDGVNGNPTFQLTGIAAAIANMGGTGMLAIVGGSTIAGREIRGTLNQITVADGNGGHDPTISISSNPVIPGTGAMTLPTGDTSQRPLGNGGQIRYNSQTGEYEVYYNNNWLDLAVMGALLDVYNNGSLVGSQDGLNFIAGNGMTYTISDDVINNRINVTQGISQSVSITTLNTTNIEVTNLKAKDGTAAGTIADTTGVVTLNSSVLTTADINGGTIDGTIIGAVSPAAGTFTSANATDVNATTVDTTNIEVTNLKAKDGTAAGSISNATGVVTLNSAVLTTADINGGTIDATVIGGSTPAAGTFTSVDTDYVDFAPALSPLPANQTARLYYDSENQFQTLVFQMNGNVVQKIGEEQFYRVKCSGAVTKGQVVMFAGTLGASGGLVGAAATGLSPEQSNYILGVAIETGANNDWIFVTSFGEVKNIDTTGGAENWQQGDVLYYNPAVTGGLTKTKPSSPNAIAVVAAVVHVGSANGILFVRPTFGSVLGGTDGNVQFGTLSDGDVIVYDFGDSRWENRAQSTLTVGTATNLAGGAAGSIPYQTNTNTTAMLAAGSGVLVGGSTPSYSTAPALTGTNFTSIPNAALQNSAVTIGTTSISLGASSLTLAGLTSIALTQNPTTALQAATKQYVDNLVATGTVYHTPVKYEVPNSTGNLTATYNNGTAGVGATLTNAGTLAAFAPDGPTAQVGDRVLIYNQTNQFENGVYEVTTVGDGSTPWVLTRTTDTDSYGLNDATALGEGSTFFVTSGNTGAGETYTCNTVGTITFGTTAITFAQISATQVYSAGTGLTLTGTQFSLTTPVVLANGGTGLTSYAAGDLPYFATGTAFSKLAIGSSTYMLTSSGSAPQWTDPASVTVGNATNAANVATTITGTNANFYIPFVSASTTGNQALGVDAGLTYNPSTNAITGGISGGTF